MIYLNIKHLLFLVLLGSAMNVNGQAFTLPDEELKFSFTTQNGKKVTVNKGKENNYLIYRFSSKDKIEFAFPDTSKNSWKAFKYSFYLRGGGPQNEGMDLNYLYFTNNGFRYVVYDTYYAVGNKQEIGIKIINLTTNKTTNIKGDRKTRKGTLTGFRDNNLVEIGEELFD